MKVAFLTMDFREHYRNYAKATPYFAPGSTSLFEGFALRQDVEVHVVTCAQRPVAAPEKLAPNIWFHSLLTPKIGWMRTGYQGCIRAVRRKLRALQPDIAHGIGTERDCAICAVFSGFPNVVTMAGIMSEQARLSKPRFGSYLWLAVRLENFTLPRAGGVICNSRYTEERVRSRARKTWTVYPALRSAFLEPPPAAGPRPCVLLNAGVISPRKRQLELLGVAEELHRRGLKFEFRFIGILPPGDPYGAAFLEKIKPLEAKGCARYLGTLPEDELVPCFDSVSGLVHFPTEEAFGSSVCEALARNLKLFGTRTGGIVEIGGDAPGAELFEKEDWAGLTDAIARWIQEGHHCPTGAAALMRQRYHPEVFARLHLEVYREVLASRKN
jgi:glycosyltransferase involved in cell wall biosynthesis